MNRSFSAPLEILWVKRTLPDTVWAAHDLPAWMIDEVDDERALEIRHNLTKAASTGNLELGRF